MSRSLSLHFQPDNGLRSRLLPLFERLIHKPLARRIRLRDCKLIVLNKKARPGLPGGLFVTAQQKEPPRYKRGGHWVN